MGTVVERLLIPNDNEPALVHEGDGEWIWHP